MVSKMEKKLRRKLDVTKVRKQQKSIKLVKALKVHSVEKRKIHCHAKFPSNQFIVKFFSKMLI